MVIRDFIRSHSTYKYEKRTLKNTEYLHSLINNSICTFTYITYLSFYNFFQDLLIFLKLAEINQCYSAKMSIDFSLAEKYPCKAGPKLHQQKELVINFRGY